MINGQVFRNRTDNRTWYIARFRPAHEQFSGVQVVQQDGQENIVRNYLATDAYYEPATKTGGLKRAKVVNYDSAGNITDENWLLPLTIPRLERDALSFEQRQRAPGVPRHLRTARVCAFNADFPETLLAPISHSTTISLGAALDLFRCCHDGRAAWDWLLAARHSRERRGGDRASSLR